MGCHCSFCSSRDLCVCFLDGSIVQIFDFSSISSVVVRSNSLICTALTFLSSGVAGDMLFGACTLSSVTASSFRVLLGGVLDPPINCQNDIRLLSASLSWSSDSCHFTRDWCLVSLSELFLFFRLPLIVFLVRCGVNVTSSSFDS